MRLVSRALSDWPDVAQRHEWPTLLLGNGLSVNIWPRFGYDYLLGKARVSRAADAVFKNMNTTNFEAVLESVMHAQVVLRALGKNVSSVDGLYTEIREALFDAIQRVHVRHASLPSSTLRVIGEVLDDHESIFTTNYDLLPYWALMDSPRFRIADFFWGGGQHTFDAARTDVFAGWSALYYLHGAVHPWQSDASGATGKWINQSSSLLELAGAYRRHPRRRPLFVSEGTTRAKQRTIRRSDYLSFALESLRRDQSDTVIFGHSLSGQDDHIVSALTLGPRRRFAVSLRPDRRVRLNAAMARIRERLDPHNVDFFDATTHPLGQPTLTVKP